MDVLAVILKVVQIASALVTMLLVLLHSPKGEGIGGLGGTANLFTTQRGAESTLNKITAYAVGTFIVASFILGYYF